jgi:hypothetical protein
MAGNQDCMEWQVRGGEVTTNRHDRARLVIGLVFLAAGLVLVIAAVLLLLFADLPAAVSAVMGVSGMGLIATSSTVATSRRLQR